MTMFIFVHMFAFVFVRVHKGMVMVWGVAFRLIQLLAHPLTHLPSKHHSPYPVIV